MCNEQKPRLESLIDNRLKMIAYEMGVISYTLNVIEKNGVSIEALEQAKSFLPIIRDYIDETIGFTKQLDYEYIPFKRN